MVLRWVAASVLDAAKGFRRVKGCKDMPALVADLRARDVRLGLGIVRVWGRNRAPSPPLRFNSAWNIPLSA